MKLVALLILATALAGAAAANKSAMQSHRTFKLINYVSHYPHGSVPLAYDKDGCPVFSVDDGRNVLKVCPSGQALFAIENR